MIPRTPFDDSADILNDATKKLRITDADNFVKFLVTSTVHASIQWVELVQLHAPSYLEVLIGEHDLLQLEQITDRIHGHVYGQLIKFKNVKNQLHRPSLADVASYPIHFSFRLLFGKEIRPGDIGGQNCQLPLCHNSRDFYIQGVITHGFIMVVAQPATEGDETELSLAYVAGLEFLA